MDAFWGDSTLLPAMRSNRVKGNLVLSRGRYVRIHAGSDGHARLARNLPESSASLLLHPPAAFAWQEIGPLYELDRAIVDQIMQGRVSDMRVFGAEIAAYDLNTVYRLLIRIAFSPRRMFERLPNIYSEYLQTGRLVVGEASEEGGTLTLEGAVLPRYLCQYGLVGWIEAALRLTGAPAPAIEMPRCVHRGENVCNFRIRF